MGVCVLVDPYAPHNDLCQVWHGGYCDCNDEAVAALNRPHCTECDFVHGDGMNRCNCQGECLYPNESDHFRCGVYS